MLGFGYISYKSKLITNGSWSMSIPRAAISVATRTQPLVFECFQNTLSLFGFIARMLAAIIFCAKP
jgi:hypothetical protein